MKTQPDLHKLSIIGYWSDPNESVEWSVGFPDPQDLIWDWGLRERLCVLNHLRNGKVFRRFMGLSTCRICGESLGCEELTDGKWAWPQGLAHYVEEHNVRLPEEFIRYSLNPELRLPRWSENLEPETFLEAEHGSVMPADPDRRRSWWIDQSDWLDWASENTPPRPAEDAIELMEARTICQRLSHSCWRVGIDETKGKWCVQISYENESSRIYLQTCSGRVLERRLLSLRLPPNEDLLEAEQAVSIAEEYDGAWGAARVLAATPQAWFLWIKRPEAEWPTNQKVSETLQGQHEFGWATTYADGSTSFITPVTDEIGWRWMLTCVRENAIQASQDNGFSGSTEIISQTSLQNYLIQRFRDWIRRLANSWSS
jgi:hypothetical protein